MLQCRDSTQQRALQRTPSGEQELTQSYKVNTISFVASCSLFCSKIIKFCTFIHLLQAKITVVVSFNLVHSVFIDWEGVARTPPLRQKQNESRLR